MSLTAVLLLDEEPYLQALRRLVQQIRPMWQLLCTTQPEFATGWFTGDNAPDLVICDERVAEQSGLDFLAFAQEYSPLTLRVMLVGAAEQHLLLAEQTPVQMLLGKPCDEAELAEVFDRAQRLAQGPFSRHSRYQIGQIPRLPVLRQQAAQLQKMLNDDAVENRQIAKAIAHDTTLSAKLLQIANSSYLGYASTTADLFEATGRLGRRLIAAVVQSMQLQEQFIHVIRADIHQQLQEQAFALATLANRLAKSQQPTNKVLAEQAFVAGLMHILGPLVMLSGQPLDMQSLTQEDMLQDGITDHCLVSAYLLTLWGFDTTLCEAVLYRRDIPATDDISPLLAIVHLASYVLDLGRDPEHAVLSVQALALLRLTPEFMALLPGQPDLQLP